MRWSDVVDLFGDVLPKRWKPFVAAVVLVSFVMPGHPGQVVFELYVRDKAAGIVDDFVNPMLREIQGRSDAVPTAPPGPDGGERAPVNRHNDATRPSLQ